MIDQPKNTLPRVGMVLSNYDTELALHFKCNDNAASSTVLDSSGNGFDGKIVDTAGTEFNTSTVNVSGKINDAFDFSAGTYSLKVDDAVYTLDPDVYSCSMWVYPTTTPQVSRYLYYQYPKFSLRYTNNLTLEAKVFSGGLTSSITVTTGITLNTWWHLTITYDGNNLKIYRNGTLIDTSSFSGEFNPLDSALTDLYFSANYVGSSESFGYMDDIRLYNGALVQSEVDDIYNSGSGTEADIVFAGGGGVNFEGELVGSWLNKKTVGGEDYSDNGNDGTATDVVFGDVGGEFNGSSSTIDMGNVLNQTTGNITMSAWVKRNNTALTEVILSKKLTHSGTGDTGYAFYFSNLNLVTLLAGTSDRSYLGGTTDIVAGEWVHCVGIVDITNDLHTLVVNGAVLISAAGSNLLSTIGSVSNSQGFRIGSDDTPSDYFDGEIRDARIYNEAKSTDWAAHEYNKGVPDDSLALHVYDQAKDLSRYNHAMTIIGTGVVLGKEIDMINTTSALSTPANAAYSASPNGIITAMCWTRLANNNTHSYFGTDNNSQGWSFKSGSGRKLALTVRYSGTDLNFVSTDVVPTAIWKHVAVVYQNDTCVFYINGEEVSGYDTTTDGVGTINNDTGLVMGVGCRNGGTSNEVKKMKDARVYNEAKSADFIKDYYLRTKGKY